MVASPAPQAVLPAAMRSLPAAARRLGQLRHGAPEPFAERQSSDAMRCLCHPSMGAAILLFPRVFTPGFVPICQRLLCRCAAGTYEHIENDPQRIPQKEVGLCSDWKAEE